MSGNARGVVVAVGEVKSVQTLEKRLETVTFGCYSVGSSKNLRKTCRLLNSSQHLDLNCSWF